MNEVYFTNVAKTFVQTKTFRNWLNHFVFTKVFLKIKLKTNCAHVNWVSLNWDVVYVTIGNPAFCLASYLNGFRGELQHIGDVSEQ